MFIKSKSLKAFVCFILILLLNLAQGSLLLVGRAYASERTVPVINRVYTDQEMKIGEKVRFVAEAEGENLQFEFHLYRNEQELYVEDYGINNYFDYTIGEAGIYRVEVNVKDEASNIVSKSSDNMEVKEEISLKIDSLTINKTGTQLAGTALKFVVKAEGEGLSYDWDIYNGSSVVYKKQHSQDSFADYTPKEPGSYKAIVTVSDKNGQTLKKESAVIQIYNPVKIVSVTADKSGRQPVNTVIKFTASASGYNRMYEWHIYKDSKEVYKGIYGKYNFIQYTPRQAGSYKVQVYVRDGFGKIASKYSSNITIYKPQSTKEIAEAFVNGKGFSSKTKNFIWVNTTKNEVYVFEGKAGNWKLIRTMACTDGKASTPTIKGNFAISGRGPWLISPSNSNVRAKYKVRITGGYYFHSILVNASGHIIDSRLGQSLSHGCVRLSIDNAKWMYYNIKDGTGVHIG